MRTHEFEENRKFMQNVRFFGNKQINLDFLNAEQHNAISSVLFTIVFKKGEMIVT